MSPKINFFDQISPFLDGQLYGTEKVEFEKQLQNDPLLKGEFQFQQDVISSVKDYRIAQLKARLNNIPIPAPNTMVSTNLAALKIAGSLLLISAIGTGGYLYYQNQVNTQSTVGTTSPNQIELSEEDLIGHTMIEELPTPPQIHAEDIENTEPQEQDEPLTVKREISTSSSTKTSQPRNIVREPRSVQPTIIEGFQDEESFPSEDELGLPYKTFDEKNIKEIAHVEFSNTIDGKHSFHYQHYNNKLFLYGDFNNIPYEILELNNAKGRKLYLFYQGEFYDIKSDQEEIAPLVEIKDRKLINQLSPLIENKD